jgi:hypothetical protein
MITTETIYIQVTSGERQAPLVQRPAVVRDFVNQYSQAQL